MPTDSSSRIDPYLSALADMATMVADARASFDRERRLPDRLFRALAEAGLLRLWLPNALSGPELTPHEFMTIVEAASALDGSIGWIVGNGAGMSRVGGYLPEPIVREWFANPLAFVVSATGAVGAATPVADGFRVTGRWPFGSGAHHASHFMALAATSDDLANGRSPRCVYFAREQVTIHDTWHVSGLRGTGSCDFAVTDVFVPSEHTHDFLMPAPTQSGTLYRIPGLSIFPWSITGAALGIAQGALTAFTSGAIARKVRQGAAVPLQDREIVQTAVGRADATLGAARAFLSHAMTDLLAALDDEEELKRARVRLRTACAYAAECASQVVATLTTEAGAGTIFESHPLERINRDIHAAVRHIAMSPQIYTVAGRLKLGLDPGTTRF